MEKTINDLDELLRKLELTYQEDKKAQDSFNVFDAFRIQRSELAWSAWIAYLLNPNENHGCGDKFLRLFLKHVNLPENFVINIAQDNKIVERAIGHIDEKYESGGRIDIIVHDPNVNNAIIIENKIDAADQKNQLYRYYKYANKEFNKFCIFYLTLLKSKPSEKSIKGDEKELQEGTDFVCISYIDNIKKWLKDCIKESDESKPVSNIIEQSIIEIDTICHQTVVNEDFRRKVEEVLNANGKTSIAGKLEVLYTIKIEEYPQCLEQISSLIKIYQRDRFTEIIHAHFPFADISQEGKLDGYWCCKATLAKRKDIEYIYVMKDWEKGSLYYGIKFRDIQKGLYQKLIEYKDLLFKDPNDSSKLMWEIKGNDNFVELYSKLEKTLEVIDKK